MKTTINDLLAALPQDDSVPEVPALFDNDEAREQLKAIFADVAQKPVPVRSLHRLWTMGELSTQVALAYTALWFRQWFAEGEARERQAMETNLRVALKLVHRLGYLRGAATKLGQAFGSLHEMLPAQVVDTLDMLHAQAPPMHFSLLREMVRNELGKDTSDLFATFDREPFAAASIGQVHRATLKSGETVAVKIQYPGIARAMEADVRNLLTLIFPMRLTRNWEYLKGMIGAVQEMLVQEADYKNEAENMREARALFAPNEGIVVPRVYEEYSSTRVLTSEFVPGLSLSAFLATAPAQDVRDEFGRKMLLAWYRMYFANRSYADPHTGNYVFLKDGRLGLLDFGCIQRFSKEDLDLMKLGEAFFEGKMPFEEFALLSGYASKADLANPDFAGASLRHNEWLAKPLWHEGPFDFGDEKFFKEGVDSMQEIVVKRYTAAPPMYAYMFRSIFGWRALGLRLKCRVDQRAIWLHERERRRSRPS